MKRVLILFACLLEVTGCGSPGIAFEEYPKASQTAVCDYNVRCGIATSAQCSSIPANGELQPLFNSGKITWDAQAAQACLDGYAAKSCWLHSEVLPDPCTEAVVGQVPVGGACYTNWFGLECASKRCEGNEPSCDQTKACCAGTCVAVAKEGQSCESTLCESDLECTSTESGKVCVDTKIPENGDCSSADATCEFGLVCIDSATGSRRCSELPGENEACTVVCGAMDLFCNVATHKCEKLRSAGETCANSLACGMLRGTCVAGKCVDNGIEGAACGSSTDPDCYFHFKCVDGKCKAPASTILGPISSCQ